MEGKTACTVLQEMLVRLGKTPQYEMVATHGPPHSVTFEYRCEALNVTANHTAASKKEAKQGAARLVLKQLADRGMKGIPPQYTVDPLSVVNAEGTAGCTSTPGRRAVALLHDLCEEFGLGGADYELVGDTGPPHMRQFTIRVQVGAHFRTATAGNKKTARALAAHQLYQYLKENLARLTGEIDEAAALSRAHERAMERYCEVKDTAPRPLLGQRIADYHLGLKAAHDAESIQKAREALAELADDPGAAVTEVAKVLGLEIAWRGECPMLLAMTPTAPPLVFGGLTPERASQSAYRYLITVLQF